MFIMESNKDTTKNIDLCISTNIDKEPYIKTLTTDKIINLTGESGSGKSYFARKWQDDDNYIIIDTDMIFSSAKTNQKEILDLRKIFQDQPKDILFTDFDYCYQEILKYFKGSPKTIVIDSAQYRNVKDISILKGEIIIMRTSIDKCYERCIDRWKIKNNHNYTEEELQQYKEKKLGIYEWYNSLNEFITKIAKMK